jgi:hypothetical protein
MTSAKRSLINYGIIALVSLGARSVIAQPVVISDLFEAKATVESVDLRTRVVLLRDDDGGLESVIASPEVRNLAQVHAGDSVLVGIHRSVVLEISKPGSTPLNAVEETRIRALPGGMPRASRGATVHARVRITDIDLANKTVSFLGPTGVSRTMQITDARLLNFVQTLHKGDEVDVTYSLSIAARLVTANR